MTFFIIALVLINLGLWIIFLFKFKDLFSTDKIIEKTRYEMEKLVKDINNNAEIMRSKLVDFDGKKTLVDKLDKVSFMPVRLCMGGGKPIGDNQHGTLYCSHVLLPQNSRSFYTNK